MVQVTGCKSRDQDETLRSMVTHPPMIQTGKSRSHDNGVQGSHDKQPGSKIKTKPCLRTLYHCQRTPEKTITVGINFVDIHHV